MHITQQITLSKSPKRKNSIYKEVELVTALGRTYLKVSTMTKYDDKICLADIDFGLSYSLTL